jgi:hypothetical protein
MCSFYSIQSAKRCRDSKDKVSIFGLMRHISPRKVYYLIEPPPSAPTAIGKMPVATAPPLPPLDPPQEQVNL